MTNRYQQKSATEAHVRVEAAITLLYPIFNCLETSGADVGVIEAYSHALHALEKAAQRIGEHARNTDK